MPVPSAPSSDPAPLRPNAPEESACLTAARTPGDPGTTERPVTPIAPRDPRSSRTLSERDLAVLTWVALLGIMTQGQIAIRWFHGRSEVTVSRCVKRLRSLGLIETMRWNKIGSNLVRLRSAGRELLLERGVPQDQIFEARWPTPGGLAHRLWVVDVALALARIGSWRTQTCWQLRRKLAGTSSPVPDLLALSQDGKRIVAIEVDVAHENLKRFVVPRVEVLDAALSSWAPEARSAIVFLTLGARRADSLRSQIPPTTATVAVELLPPAVGRPAVEALMELFTRA